MRGPDTMPPPLLMIAFYPQHPFGLTVRIALFSIFPTGFAAFLPAAAVRAGDPLLVLALLAAALAYAALALLVFERGLRRYSTGNRLIELR